MSSGRDRSDAESGDKGFSITCSNVRLGKYIDMTYSEPPRHLAVELELAGFFTGFDWVGTSEDLAAWTRPAGEAIPQDKQRQIERRIIAWGRADGRRRIGFFPREADDTPEELLAAGYTRELLSDGTVKYTPPKSFLVRIGSVVGYYRKLLKKRRELLKAKSRDEGE